MTVQSPARPRVRRLSYGFSSLVLAFGLAAGAGAAAVAAPADTDATPTSPTQAQSCPPGVALVNGTFEEPEINPSATRQLPASEVPGWDTTDQANKIELWSSGFHGVQAAQGNQFAELNATSASMLYQSVETVPGQTLQWSLKHRGRSGMDTMKVMIGASKDTLSQSGPNLTDGTGAWGTHTGTYRVPAGQTTTVFGFQAVSSAGGDKSIGNFLDDITFGTEPCVIATKTVTNLTDSTDEGGAEVGDVLRYTVTFENQGGNAAGSPVSKDEIDAGLAYVPGSLALTTADETLELSDTAGDDQGEYDSDDAAVIVRPAPDATASGGGSIGVGEQVSYSFDAKVLPNAAGSEVQNQAGVDYHSNLSDEPKTAQSNETTTPVSAGADLAVSKTIDTDVLLPGAPIQFTITATNNGPDPATSVVVTDPIPEGLSDASATTDSGTCEVAAGAITCKLDDLAVGDSATITVDATIEAGVAYDDIVENTATVAGDQFDPDSSNNSATATKPMTPSADVSILKSADSAQVGPGEQVTYTLAVRNEGPATAKDVTASDELPGALVDPSVDSQDCEVDENVVSCQFGDLPASAERTIQISATVADSTTPGDVANSADVSAQTYDPDSSNNSSTATVEIVEDEPNPGDDTDEADSSAQADGTDNADSTDQADSSDNADSSAQADGSDNADSTDQADSSDNTDGADSADGSDQNAAAAGANAASNTNATAASGTSDASSSDSVNASGTETAASDSGDDQGAASDHLPSTGTALGGFGVAAVLVLVGVVTVLYTRNRRAHQA